MKPSIRSRVGRSYASLHEIKHLSLPEIVTRERSFQRNVVLLVLGFAFLALATWVITPWLDSLMAV